jgi:5-(carboxyamino)imidazole ribonucleotide synthase
VSLRLGILGNGQLGRMLAVCAHQLGIEPRVFGKASGPATDVTRASTLAPFDDEAALEAFAAGVDAVTYELEQLPVLALAAAARGAPVFPSALALATTQDRLLEKRFLLGQGLAVAPFAPLEEACDEAALAHDVGFPCLLKTRQGGYDGKGQRLVASAAELGAARRALGVPCVAERVVQLERELSLLAVRGRDGEVAFYDPVENQHEGGILRVSRAPAVIDESTLEALHRQVGELLEAFGYVGVLAVELFETPAGVLVNELAPRVHNSGHWTLEGAVTSQFENHVRAVMGLPLGRTASRGHSAMVNLVGSLPPLAALLAVPGAAVHLYGKSPAPGRKLGHVTLCAEAPLALEEGLLRLQALLP